MKGLGVRPRLQFAFVVIAAARLIPLVTLGENTKKPVPKYFLRMRHDKFFNLREDLKRPHKFLIKWKFHPYSDLCVEFHWRYMFRKLEVFEMPMVALNKHDIRAKLVTKVS
jgi:hypothetical protein